MPIATKKAAAKRVLSKKGVKKRPSGGQNTYDPRFALIGRELRASGFTMQEVAVYFDKHESTLYHWMGKYPDFKEAMKQGTETAVHRVANALFETAIGRTYKEQVPTKIKQVDYDPDTGKRTQERETVVVTEVEKVQQPNPTAQMFFLKNRAPESWRDKHEITHASAIDMLSDAEINRLLREEGSTMTIEADYEVVDDVPMDDDEAEATEHEDDEHVYRPSRAR